MARLHDSLASITGVGAMKAKDFARLGLHTLHDVLLDFPFRYDDLSHVLPIAFVRTGEKVTVQGTLISVRNRKSQRSSRMTVTEAVIQDDTGSLQAVWFHQGFLTKVLKPGQVVSLAGKADDRYGLSLVNPMYEVISSGKGPKQTGRIVAVYRLTGALTQKFRRRVAEVALAAAEGIEDWIPSWMLHEGQLESLASAVQELHLPSSLEAKDRALRRMKFEEFFLHQLLAAASRRELQMKRAPRVVFHEELVRTVVGELPFALTGAQKKAIWAIIKDMDRPEPMNRLLEGDVGSGKTVVAAVVAVNAAESGLQTSMLAPTEILAEQHAQTLQRLLGHRLTIGLYTRTKRRIGEEEVTKAQWLAAARAGTIHLAVGTHALLSDDVVFAHLGLVVVDEQHRFGVKQRQALKEKRGEDEVPHLLSMTATPIPRSLALVLYGDLDRCVLNEYPVGRKAITTEVVEPGYEQDAIALMQREMDAGRQVFAVCPLIEESDALGANSVQELWRYFHEGPFARYRVAMLHGRMPWKERDATMRAFAQGEMDMVVATTVVEVGVDVRNATVMYIEGAERFGLAQLHQLRGRVGRGDQQSYCFLHPSGILSPVARERLEAVAASQDGFALAEKDLQLRGGGNVYGIEQSGFQSFKLGTMQDIDLMSMAKDFSKAVLDESPDLARYPALRDRMRAQAEEVHFE